MLYIIVIAIRAGIWNIYVVETCRGSITCSPRTTNKDVLGSWALVVCRSRVQSMPIINIEENERKSTIQIQKYEYL